MSTTAATVVATKVTIPIPTMFEKKIKKGKTKSDAWNHFTEILDDSEDDHECTHCPVNHNTFKFCRNRETSGSYNRTKPLKYLKTIYHNVWMMTKSGNNSEAKAEATREKNLSKLVSFNSTNETKVNLVSGKSTKSQA